tara:strand:- start:838 stop:1374 length:537 start_codon:yes stop_codon:yes gene_type:complete
MPFIVGVGDLPEDEMSLGSIALSSLLGGDVKKLSCEQSPNDVISSLYKEDGIFQLCGDAAYLNTQEGSWLEALGAWKVPTILMVLARADGNVPGMSSAYVALCKKLSVPLIGIIQLGGEWNSKSRYLDGLPWCGIIPIQKLPNRENILSKNYIELIEVEEVLGNITRKMRELNLKKIS